MVCIYCRKNTIVANSRPQIRSYQTWRRRKCKSCGAVFTTIEKVDLTSSLVVKNQDGTIESFNGDALFVSVLHAVGHRNNPLNDARAITDTVIGRLIHNATGAVISSQQIIMAVTKSLERFDKSAAIQYVAYHKR